MGLKKGMTNNKSGRPKGTPNKTTTELKQWINILISNNIQQLTKDLKKMEPAERWRIVEKLMAYVIPKQQAVTAEIELNNLTDEQINMIINQININDDE